MIRVLLAVAVALALFAVAAPAAADAREYRSDRTVSADLQAVADAGTSLLDREDPTPGGGARRFVTLRIPGDSFTTERVEWVALGGRPGAADPDPRVGAYAPAGGRTRTIELPFALRTGGEPLVLDGTGEYELLVTLATGGVRVERAGDHVGSDGRGAT